MSHSTAMRLVTQFLGRQNIIAVPVPFVRILGDYESAALLAQCLYWGDRTEDPDGWFYKTHEQWAEELRLSSDQVRRCVKTCAGMIEVKLRGVPAKNHYRVDHARVAAALEKLANENRSSTTRCGETQQLSMDKPNDLPSRNPTASRTENPTTNTKTTSETTSKRKDSPLPPEGEARDSAAPFDQNDGLDELFAEAEQQAAVAAGDVAPLTSREIDSSSPEVAVNRATSLEDVPGGAARVTPPDSRRGVAPLAGDNNLNAAIPQDANSSALAGPYSAKPSRRRSVLPIPALPTDLAALPGVQAAWDRWLTYRAESQLSTPPTTADAQFTRLRHLHKSGEDLPAVIERAIEHTWKGFWETRSKTSRAARPKDSAEADTRALNDAHALYSSLQEDDRLAF